MNVPNIFQRLAGMIAPKSTLEKKLGVQVATSTIMENAISLWLDMYKDEPPWMSPSDGIKTMNLPATIAEEMARLVLTEFGLTLDGSERAAFINDCLQNFLTNMSKIVEIWCAGGGVALKPYVFGSDNNGIPTKVGVDIIHANRFYPTAFNSNGEVTGAVFVDTKRIGDYLYTRLECHNLDRNRYTVKNMAFRSERLNTVYSEDEQITCQNPFSEEIALETVPEWSGIAPETTIEGVGKPFFVYIKVPKANNIDPNSPLGASVYSRATDMIQEADIQFSRTLWEYQATEAAVFADESIFDSDKRGKAILPRGGERKFKTFDFEGTSSAGLLKEFAPAIRDTSLFNGLNQILRKIELQCGLAYGTLSEVSDIAKTATEIKASKQRSYTTVNAMQKAWQCGITELINIMDALCTLYGIVPAGAVNPTITWGDGVLEDTEVEYQRRWAMVVSGKLKLEKFIAWYFGCTEEEAKDYIPAAGAQYPPEE